MSNLNLPNLSFDSLRHGLVWNTPKTIAYATTANMRTLDGSPYIEIKHHGNTIATLNRDSVYIDTCGWDSKTTAMRLDRVLRDNGIPVRVVIRQGVTSLAEHPDVRKLICEGIGTAHFARGDQGEWNLLNAQAEHAVSA